MELIASKAKAGAFWRSLPRGYRETEAPSALGQVFRLNGQAAEAFAGGWNTALPLLGLLREAWFAIPVGSSLLITTWTSIWACLSCGACRSREVGLYDSAAIDGDGVFHHGG